MLKTLKINFPKKKTTEDIPRGTASAILESSFEEIPEKPSIEILLDSRKKLESYPGKILEGSPDGILGELWKNMEEILEATDVETL